MFVGDGDDYREIAAVAPARVAMGATGVDR